MSRGTIALIWLAGLVVAAVVYVAGPDRVVFAVFDFLSQAWWNLQDVLHRLSLEAFDAVRALAIGLYCVFVVLGFLVARRGGRAGAALVVVTLVFLGLVWHAPGEGFGAHTRWMAALVLAIAAALAMTRRLTEPGASPWRSGPMPPPPPR
jgi:hypothetical protein